MALSQREKTFQDIERSIARAEEFNEKSPVTTRQMTEEERREVEWQTSKHESYHKLKI